jgi:amyloid beta precursor protein binding protein 1
LQVALAHLLEMNEDCKGEAHVSSPADLIGANPAFFEGFTLVIASQLQRDTLLALSSILWALDIPLVAARSYGLIGHLRLARPVHLCYETKDAQAKADLRIANPFPALRDMAASFDLAAVDDDTHKHLPYPILLIILMQKFEAETGSRPKTFAERKAFGKWIETQRRDIVTDEGVPIWEENFDEAVTNASFASLVSSVRAAARMADIVNASFGHAHRFSFVLAALSTNAGAA